MNDLAELKKKTIYVAMIIFFGCSGPAMFLLLYPNFKIVGFTFFAVCILFCLILFQALPKADEFTVPKETVQKELEKIKKPAERCKNYLKYILLLIILLPILAGIVYWSSKNIVVTDILLALSLIIAGTFFALYYYYLNLNKKLKKLTKIYQDPLE